MNELEEKIYKDIEHYYYKILEKNKVKILDRTFSSILSSCYSSTEAFNALEKKEELRENFSWLEYKDTPEFQEFADALMAKYCHPNKDIKITSNHNPEDEIYYRGVSIPKKTYLKNLTSKIYTFHRDGCFGKGQYFTLDRNVALNYAGFKEENILTAVVDKDIKEVDFSRVYDTMKDFAIKLHINRNDYDKDVVFFISQQISRGEPYLVSVFAGALGYDAINGNYYNTKKSTILCVLNPEKVKFIEK